MRDLDIEQIAKSTAIKVLGFPVQLTKEEFKDQSKQLAREQRGAPENAMRNIQLSQIAQLYGYLAEHIGDLIHRMAEEPFYFHGGFDVVHEKLKRIDMYLNDRYGFEREFKEQITENLKYDIAQGKVKYKSFDEAYEALRKLGKIYADEHRKLKPINRAQSLARLAAVAYGEFRFNDVRNVISQLKSKVDQGLEVWEKFATEYPQDKIIDTNNLTGSENMGNAGVIQDGRIIAYHVSDHPEKVINILKQNLPLSLGRDQGKVGDLGTSGLYFSAVPQLWLNRSTEKWSFLNTLSESQLHKLIDSLIEDIKKQRKERYIADFEEEIGLRDLNYIKDGLLLRDLLVYYAGQPYNIEFWRKKYLNKLGIEPGPEPKIVEVELKGKFLDLTDQNISGSAMNEIISKYDGAFFRGTMGRDPQGVTWNNNSVLRFGDFKR